MSGWMVLLTGFFIALLFLLWTRIKTVLTYYQQEEYDTTRFIHAFFRIRLYDVVSSLALLVLFAAGYDHYRGWVLLVAVVILLLVAWREQRYAMKKAYVATERSQRIRCLAAGMMAVSALSVFIHPLLAVIVLQLPAAAIMLANRLLSPLQTRINQRFIAQARERLAHYDGVRIGITGSFGKTTIKHVLGHVLAVDAPVFYSKGSINTILGLTRHIRQRLQPAQRYLIAEMGAYRQGSIDALCQFIQPEYGIVSAVGSAHTERFGDVGEVAKAKSELAAWICAHGQCVVTTEDVVTLPPFAALRSRHAEKFIICGYSDAADVRISDEQMTMQGRQFNVTFKQPVAGISTLSLNIPLLGQHNTMNTALIVALVSRIAPDLLPRLGDNLKHTPQIPHRLQIKTHATGPLILDDAYNANETGFINAVATLRSLAQQKGGKGVLVTPGVAELGAEHDAVHRRLADAAVQNCDMICVVNPDRIPGFVAQVKQHEYDALHTFADLKAAQAFLQTQNLSAQDVVLYENDLPDLLESRRLL